MDDLRFAVQRSPRRRALEIIVDRNSELVIAAPLDAPQAELLSFVRKKQFWVYTKLALKQGQQQPVASKAFVSGEGFVYLGRSYRLLLVDAQDCPLKFEAGRFKLLRSEAEHGRVHFTRWYSERAERWVKPRVRQWASRLGVAPTRVDIRDLGYRWGSCGRDGGLNFHWVIAMLPAPLIEYVIVHELVHLHQANHTPEFWQRVARALPDFELRKQELAEQGGRHLAL